jgi:predicted transcriptional regulator
MSAIESPCISEKLVARVEEKSLNLRLSQKMHIPKILIPTKKGRIPMMALMTMPLLFVIVFRMMLNPF